MIKRRPDHRDQLTRQGAYVDQYGAQRVAQPDVQVYIQGRYGPRPERETVRQIDGTALGSATCARDGALTKTTSGLVAGETIRLQSNKFLNYAPSFVAEYTAFVYREQAPTETQVWRHGAFNAEDGLFFEESASGVSMVVRNNGTDRTLSSIAAAGDGAWIFETPTPDLFDKGRVGFISFSWYGGGIEVFGLKETDNVDPQDQGETERIFGVYVPKLDSTLSGPYMRTPNLPAAIAIDNGASSPSRELVVYSNDRQLKLSQPVEDEPLVIEEQFGPFDVGTSREALIAIRPVLNFQGRPNDVNVRITGVEFDAVDSANNVNIYTTLGADITGGTWTDGELDDPQSAVEIGTTTNIGTVDLTDSIIVPPRALLRASASNKTSSKAVEDERLTLGDEQVYLIEGQASAAGTNEIYITITREESH